MVWVANVVILFVNVVKMCKFFVSDYHRIAWKV